MSGIFKIALSIVIKTVTSISLMIKFYQVLEITSCTQKSSKRFISFVVRIILQSFLIISVTSCKKLFQFHLTFRLKSLLYLKSYLTMQKTRKNRVVMENGFCKKQKSSLIYDQDELSH